MHVPLETVNDATDIWEVALLLIVPTINKLKEPGPTVTLIVCHSFLRDWLAT